MITEKVMLAAVHISVWTAVKHDRKVSREVADRHGAHQGAGRYNKQLFHGAQKPEELRSSAGQIRQHFYKVTAFVVRRGLSVLPANFYSISWRSKVASNSRIRCAAFLNGGNGIAADQFDEFVGFKPALSFSANTRSRLRTRTGQPSTGTVTV